MKTTVIKLEEQYDRVCKSKRTLFKKLQHARVKAGWKFCPYQGCNECYSNNGLISPDRLKANGWG